MNKTFDPNTAQIDQDLITANTKPSFNFDPGSAKVEEKGVLGHVRDTGISLLKGAIAIPEAAVGLADMATGGRVGKALENEGGLTGFRPKEAKDALSDLQTDQAKLQQRQFAEADGILDKTKVALTNPSLVTNTISESVPSMLGGAAVARGLMKVAPGMSGITGAAIGEGLVGAGAQASAIRQETDDGLLTGTQSAIAGATGAATSLFSLLGGKVAQKLGLGDLDTMLATGISPSKVAEAASKMSAKSIPRKTIEGAISEGFLEELPQSVSEQILQNLALDRDWSEGVQDAMVMGTLAGMAMGGGASLYSGAMTPKQEQPSGLPTESKQKIEAIRNNPNNSEPAPSLNDQIAATAEALKQKNNTPLDEDMSVFEQAINEAAAQGSVNLQGTITDFNTTENISPSQKMGLDANAGPISQAAVLAVDSGLFQTENPLTQNQPSPEEVRRQSLEASKNPDLESAVARLQEKQAKEPSEQDLFEQEQVVNTADQPTKEADQFNQARENWSNLDTKQRIELGKEAGFHPVAQTGVAARNWDDIPESLQNKLSATLPKEQPKKSEKLSEDVALENQDIEAQLPAQSNFTARIQDAHLNNPSAKLKLINDEVASGRSRAEVLAEVSKVVSDLKNKDSVQTNLATNTQTISDHVDIEATNTPVESVEQKIQDLESRISSSKKLTEKVQLRREINALQAQNDIPIANEVDPTPVRKPKTEEERAEHFQQKLIKDYDARFKSTPVADLEASLERLDGNIEKMAKASENQVVNGRRSTRKAVAAGALDNYLKEKSDLEKYIKHRKQLEVKDANTIESENDVATSNTEEPIVSDTKDVSQVNEVKATKNDSFEQSIEAQQAEDTQPENAVDLDQNDVEDTVDQAIPQEPKSNMTLYQERAKEYGRSIDNDGKIYSSTGKDTGVRLVEKKGRLRLERADGGLLFAGPTKPEALGRFLEDYWYDKRIVNKQSSTEDKKTKKADNGIQDFGEKIGGARKDTSVKLGKRETNTAPSDDRPTWAKRYDIQEIVASTNESEKGKWIIVDNKSKDYAGNPKKATRELFDSEKEAEKLLPVVAVSLKHRVISAEGGKFAIYRNVNDKKRVRVVEQDFATKEDAMNHLVANAVKILETNTTFGESDIPRPTDTVRRGIEHRKGDAQDSDFTRVFGFRGVEFGNWNNQTDRQELLNDAYDGLVDLAEVMNLPPEAISLNGELALAFGARGKGLSGAKAHYEPTYAVINLTKMNGAGSLAHEWWHALDHYFGRADGKAPSEWVHRGDGSRTLNTKKSFDDMSVTSGFSYNSKVREEVKAAYTDLVKTIYKKGETYIEDSLQVESFVSKSRDALKDKLDKIRADLSRDLDPQYYKRFNKSATTDQLAEFDTVVGTLLSGADLQTDFRYKDEKTKNSRNPFSGGRHSNDSLDKIGEILKSVRGRSGFNTDQKGPLDSVRQSMSQYSQRLKMLEDAKKGDEKVKMIPTQFAMDAKSLDQGRGSNYWSTVPEMTARAFQGYVEDKIAERGGYSPFLNYGPEVAAIPTPWGIARPFPIGNERIQINKSFDKLVESLKTEKDAGGTRLYSKGYSKLNAFENKRGISIEETRHILTNRFGKDVISKLEEKGTLRIVEEQRPEMEGVVEGWYSKGRVTLVASNLTPDTAIATLLHEIGGHAGFQNMMNKDAYANLMNQFERLVSQGNPIAVQAKYLAEREGDEQVHLEEYLPYLVTLASQQKTKSVADRNSLKRFMLDVLANVKAWLFDRLGVQLNLNEKDILALSERMLQQHANKQSSSELIRAQYQGTNQWMKAPNGKKTNLTEQQWLQVRTPEFKQWFGDWEKDPKNSSEIIDENGEPKVVYHGTANQFSEFSLGGGLLGRGVYLTDDRSTAEMYAYNKSVKDDGYVMPLFANIRKTFQSNNDMSRDQILEASNNGEYNGILHPVEKDTNFLLAFDPRQVKLAVGNTGVFDANDTDLRYSKIATTALESLHSHFSAPTTVSIWHKTVGTMYNLAQRSPHFKPVYDSAQRFLDDVSNYAYDAAELAPRILPKLDKLSDITKTPLSSADNKAISKPIFEATLIWARDESGEPILVDSLRDSTKHYTVEDKADALERTGRLDVNIHNGWKKLPYKMYEEHVNQMFESEYLRPGIVWTDAELRSMFKLNDKQVELYHEFRATTDRSIDNMGRADILRIAGQDAELLKDTVMNAPTLKEAEKILRNFFLEAARQNPDRKGQLMEMAHTIRERVRRVEQLKNDGYAPLMRFGQYTVHVGDGFGGTEYFGMFETKHDANEMAKKMRAEYGAVRVKQGTLSQEEYKIFAGVSPETLELFGNMLGLQSTGDDVQDQAFQEYLRLTKNNRSAMKRLIHRKGISGYSEDVSRVLAAFTYSNARQTATTLNMGAMDKAVTEIPKEQGELKDIAMKLREYIKNPQEEGHIIRSFLFAQYLGGSVATALLNITQVVNVSLPWLGQYGAKRAVTELAKASKDLVGKNYSPELKAALDQAEKDGVVSPQEIHQLIGQAQGRGSLHGGDGTRSGQVQAFGRNSMIRFSMMWGKLFGAAEQVNRRITYVAAYRIAQQQGNKDPDGFARHAVHETQFVYSKAAKMRWGRGVIGGTLMTFKTYTVAYVELMHRLWTQGEKGSQERKDGRKAAMLMIATLLLVGGGSGLPFIEDVEDLIDGAGQLMGYNFSMAQEREQFLADTFGKEFGAFVDKGLTGIPGAPLDVSGRLGMGNLIPGTGLLTTRSNHTRDVTEMLGPAGDFVSRVFGGSKEIIQGNFAAGALEMSPVAIRNAAKGIEMSLNDEYRDTKGYKVLETSHLEAALKSIGFQPGSVAKIQDANFRNQNSKAFYNLQAQKVRRLWAQGIYDEDPKAVQEARDMVLDWNTKNPDQKITVNMRDVYRRVREMRKPKDQRIADTAPRAMRQKMRQDVSELRDDLEIE